MHGQAASLMILLALCLGVALLFARIGVSALVAYLIAGVIAGPSVLNLVDEESIAPLAEMGANLLLFALGLEMDLDKLLVRGVRIGLAAALQIGLTVVAGTLALTVAGFDLRYGIAIGACLAVSSTVLTMRALDEQRLRHREEGSLVLGIVLMQDMALGPLLLMLSLLVPMGERAHPMLLVGGLIACLALTVALRRVLASALLRRVRAARQPELEVAFAVMVAIGAAMLTNACGLGTALGAFCAGLAFGSHDNRETVEVAVRPLQGLMAIFFFVATGVICDLRFVVSHPGLVAAAFVVSTALKAGIAALALRIIGMPLRSALGGGLLLGSIGEFSFVLAAAAFAHRGGETEKTLYQLVVTCTFLSFLIMPLVVRLARRFLPHTALERITARGATIVIAGLGPVGNTAVETLRREGHRLFLVDRNEHLLKPWQQVDNVRCHRGRIEDTEDWLPALGHRPALLVLTFPIADASAAVATRLREVMPELIIIARSPFAAQIDLLRSAGVQHVICDESETSRALLPLVRLGLPDNMAVTRRIERRTTGANSTTH